MRRLTLLLCLTAWLPAQVVHVGNSGTTDFDGWVRTVLDKHDGLPEVGIVHPDDGTMPVHYVLGNRVGLDCRSIDLRLEIAAGEQRSIDLAGAADWDWKRQDVLAESPDVFGVPAVNGTPLQLLSMAPAGAGYDLHFRGRVGRMLVANVWATHYPDQPGFARSELVACASNPTVPDLVEAFPNGLAVTWGRATVLVPGLADGDDLLTPGETIADGQARSWPMTVVWPSMLRGSNWSSAGAVSALGLSAIGLQQVWPEGDPLFRASPAAWTQQHRPGAIVRLHGWVAGPLGVAEWSGRTGAQEDQAWPGGECAHGLASLGAEQVRYLVALGQSRRPMHHLETNGDGLHLQDHPQLVFWDSRAHYHTGVSRDQLGKTRSLSKAAAHQWWGWDEEHALVGTLCLGHRLTGSHALQWQLEAHARSYLWHVNRVGATRAEGWLSLLAVRVYRELNDRALAERVAVRCRERLALAIAKWAPMRGIWDVRRDDRLGPGLQWLAYQQAIACYGLDIAGQVFGVPKARDLARMGAQSLLEHTWDHDGRRWRGWMNVQVVDGVPGPLIEGDGAHWGSGVEVWHSMGIAVLLRHDPKHERALQVWQQLVREANEGGRWVAPELVRAAR